MRNLGFSGQGCQNEFGGEMDYSCYPVLQKASMKDSTLTFKAALLARITNERH